MRSNIIIVLLLFSLFLTGAENQPVGNEIRTFTQALSQEQKILLDRFFHSLVGDSFTGYVLYGDKPICIETCPLVYEDITSLGAKEIIIAKGMEIWEELKLPLDNKNYLFLIFNAEEYGYRHLICINREAFLQAVNENLSLFRYVLGPTLTAEGLLKELIEAKERFYHVLKNDNVLLGILLGYGKQNALLVSRQESISDAFAYDQKEDFPFLSKKIRMRNSIQPKAQKKRPSLGFTSLAKEYEEIRKLTTVSRKLKPFNTHKIPHFGCEPDSNESKVLLASYEKNRNDIIQALKKESFLEDVLAKLFTTTAQTVDIPPPPPSRPLALPTDKAELVAKLAKFVHEEIKREKFCKEKLFSSFLAGAAAREKGRQNPKASQKGLQRILEEHQIEKDLEKAENSEKTNAFFNTLTFNEAVIPLISGKVYYKTLHEGEGNPISHYLKQVSFHYSFYTLENKQLEIGTVTNESPEQFIPGVVHALIGMKRGEQREIYIHPEYGYGEDAYLPPNTTLIAKLTLIDFEEGDEKVAFTAPHQLAQRNYKQILGEYEKIQMEAFFFKGFCFWDFIKKSKNPIDFQTFQRCFQKVPESPQFENETQKNQFIVDLTCSLSNFLL